MGSFGGLWGSHDRCLSLFLLPEELDVELANCSPAPCLPVCHHESNHDDNGLNLCNCKQALVNALFHKSCCGHGVSS
uniref:Uncharacterized protein n=1 Tax=Mus spicilegus TaxID=10103 RepID=A0A8C6GL42_MUSSI